MSNRDGYGHAVFVADAANNRVAVLMLNVTQEQVYWVGEITGIESGTRLRMPMGVAWDPVGTKGLSNDRLFVLDSGNDRVLVYKINFNPFVSSGSFAATYVGQFGSRGSGNRQFNAPQGIAVQSSAGYLPGGYSDVADVYIADTGNRRVARWAYVLSDPFQTVPYVSSVLESFPIAGADLTGITVDDYGDPIAADWRRNFLLKFDRGFNLLRSYGGGTSWSAGSFRRPRSPEVIYTYGDPSGLYVEAGLAYVGTDEEWSDSSGMQLHRLGIDLDNMRISSVDNAARTATFLFTLTAGGSYKATIRDGSGVLIRTFSEQVTTSGAKLVYWDGRTNSGTTANYGTNYRLSVDYKSGYQYDTPQTRTAYSSYFSFTDPNAGALSVAITGPTQIDAYTTYTWSSSATGGTTPYTYAWYRTENDGFSSPELVSTTATYSGQEEACWGFDLRLEVTATNGQSGADAKTITVNQGGHPSCLMSVAGPSGADEAPDEFQLSQDFVPGTSSSGNILPGLRRSAAPRNSSSGNVVDRSIISSVRRDGIMALRFGVPRSPLLLSRRRDQATTTAEGTSSVAWSGARAVVQIRIFDINGRLVRVAVNDAMEPGYYRFEWDGKSDSGSRLSPGVYVVVMTAQGFTKSTKLVLTR